MIRSLFVAALVAPVLLASAAAEASINFGNPYVFVSQADAEKGMALPLYGGSEREVSYVSVRVYRWVQKEDDAYALEPAPEVAVFPQMARLEPQARTSVRLAWSRFAAPVDERYYRLVMEEFDRPGKEAVDKDKASFGFRVRPRASLPLVVYGRDDIGPAQLAAQIRDVPAVMVDGKETRPASRALRVTNSGGTYGRVMGVRDAKGAVHDAMVYVLPGSTVEVPLPAVDSEQGLELLYSSGRAEHVRKENSALRSAPIG